jgi:hypothetical protein
MRREVDRAHQICDVVQNKEYDAAVVALASLLPERWRPGKVLSTIVGAAVTFCPFEVGLVVKIGQKIQKKRTSPNPSPFITPPLASLVASPAIDTTSGETQVFVSWLAFGAASYREQTRADGRLDSTVFPSGTSVYRGIRPGSTYQFFVQGFDNAGNPVFKNPASSYRFTLDIGDLGFTQNGWKTNSVSWNNYDNTLTFGTPPNLGDIRFPVQGFAMAIVAPTWRTGGSAQIWVDGAYVRNISLYSPDTKDGRIVFSTSWASSGTHEVLLRPVQGELELDAWLALRPA